MNILLQSLYQSRQSRRLSGVCRTAIAFVAGIICIVNAQCVFAADSTISTAEMDARFRDYIEWLRADLRAGKVRIYTEVMKLSADEAKVFWPLYQEYETELFALGDQRLELINKFADAYNRDALDNATAKSLTKDWFRFQTDRLKLWEKHQKRIEKSLSAIRAAQFLQIENRLNALIDLMIASEIPLIDPALAVSLPSDTKP